ncbi:Gmad2 immunoglobulin-like domain-containing protein [Kribbella sp.]|uniref:Gmad2 immunoglobulin-like domain-containing protein n=1 Tax=Kribbella sp. TaxID=1871183 RepID=UPI002D6954A6|nr:Gmad2 immunoglobulin-like domain-containing protein [Kribbella sp.]HZX05887.1 Gmad2 immunoglobulin-like domain-containing protein [Kribbella sp.]
MNDKSHDPFDELIRRALHEEADRIEPADALLEIRTRAHAQRPSTHRPWFLTAGVAAIGTAAAIGAFTVFTHTDTTANDGESVAGQPTTSAALPESPAPSILTASPLPAKTRGVPEASVHDTLVPVYWLGTQVGAQKKTSTRLYRTWSKVSGHPAEQAVRIMTTKNPADPDYYSVWRGAAVNTVTRDDDEVTVDFKQLPKTTLDEDVARVAAQQLVYTVQGALKDDQTPVRVTQNGRPVQQLFGRIDATQPLDRAQAADVQALVWIDSPVQDAALAPKVTVQGIAAAYEATVNYQATNLKTREVKKSYISTKQGQTFSAYAFQLTLSPGPWQISVYLVSPSDGSVTDTDTKAILVK